MSDYTRTGRLVLTGVWADAAIVMAASAANGGRAFVALGEPFLAGLALGLAVDVGLAVALVGDRALHLAGRSSAWGRALRVVTAGMALALNCAVAVWQGEWGVAAFHAFLPVLLVILAEYAQDSTLMFGAIAADEQAAQGHARADQELRERELVASLASVLAIGTRLASRQPVSRPTEVLPTPRRQPRPVPQAAQRAPNLAALVERARPLMPMGRAALAQELGITPHWARRVLEQISAETRRPVALVKEA